MAKRKAVANSAILGILAPSVMAAAERPFRPIYQCVHRAERQSLTLSRLRDALLPQLMSGVLRVGQAEKTIDAVV